jgi:chromosome segregation ATPase
MPLGPWKSKWEIHREDMERFREDMGRRDAEFREETDRRDRRDVEHRQEWERRDAEFRDSRIESDERWIELKEETRELRADYDRELAETRRFNRELLIRLEKTYTNLGSTLQLMGDEIIAMRGEIHDLKSAVDAQTKAILRLVDRFEDTDGRPPV